MLYLGFEIMNNLNVLRTLADKFQYKVNSAFKQGFFSEVLKPCHFTH